MPEKNEDAAPLGLPGRTQMEMDLGPLGPRRALSLPGVSCTVAEQIAALERVAPGASDLIRREPDDAVMRIVETWPRDFAPERARSLGFEAEPDFDAILRAYVEDDLGGAIPFLAGRA